MANTEQNMDHTLQENAKLEDALRKIWTLVVPFAIGWLMMMLGVSLMNYAVGQLGIGIVLMLAGIAIMPLPSVILVWGGAGLRELFNTDFFIETRYSDGRREVNFDLEGTLVNKFLTVILAIALGVIISPIRIIMGLLAYAGAKKEMGIDKLPFQLTPIFPLAVAAGSFLLGIILSLVIINVASANLDKKQHESSLSPAEITELLTSVKADIASQSISYAVSGGDEEKPCFVEIKYEAGKYTFDVKAASYYDVLTQETTASTPEQSPVPFGVYVFENGEWTGELTDEQKSFLSSLRIEAYLDFCISKAETLVMQEKDVAGTVGWVAYYYYEVDGEEKSLQLELYREPTRLYRLLWDAGLPELYGADRDILFKN